MAKPIYMTSTDVDNICAELRASLIDLKCYGNIDIKRSFKSDDRIATLLFTPKAWIKMTALVARFETEVQWHGLAQRITENTFEIYDIIVPPHEVSSATVTSEYAPYIKWLDELDDTTFNAVRFHGHSHVNMGVSPSSTDNKYRLDLVTQLPKPVDGEDVFYIFLIINKKHEWSAEVYDLTNNAVYSTDEIFMECGPDDDDIDTFIAEAKSVAVARTYTAGYTSGDYKNSYGGYYDGSYGGSSYGQKPATNPSADTGSSDKGKVKKGKKTKKKGDGDYFGYDRLEKYYEAIYGEGWQDIDPEIPEEDDPTSPFYVKEY